MTGRSAAAAVLGLAVLTGCTAPSVAPPPRDSRVEVDTPLLREAKTEVGVEPCPRVGDAGSELPALELACLGGGRPVTLAGVEGPAVVSLWASWCTPCRDELPLLQRLHEEAGERVTILSVDYQDLHPEGALELLEVTGARFPQVADPGGSLADEVRFRGLPTLLLVDGRGAVTVRSSRIRAYDDLVAVVEEGTGVPVPRR